MTLWRSPSFGRLCSRQMVFSEAKHAANLVDQRRHMRAFLTSIGSA